MKAGGFWSREVTAFFDVRVTHVNSKCNQGKATSTIFKEQKEEKKRKYQQRLLDVEMGSFTSLVFRTNGGMGADCNCFLKRLAEKLSEKNEEPYHITITWIRTLLSFEIWRSVSTHMRKRLQDTFPQNSARGFHWWLPLKCERSGCPLLF